MRNFIGDNINALRIDKGLSQNQLAELADVGQSAVSMWESGEVVPRKGSVLKIMDALNIQWTDIMSEENGYARRVFRLNNDVVNIPKDNCNLVTAIPMYGSIAAGTPIEMIEADGLHPAPIELISKYREAFYLRVEGESMNRRIPNGCLALIDPSQKDIVDGEPYALCVNGYDATIKRVRALNHGFELVPDSYDTTYIPKTYDYNRDDTDHITIIGRVVWVTMPIDYVV